MTIELKEKYLYETRQGDHVRIIMEFGSGNYPFKGDNGITYRLDGRCIGKMDSELDLVKEIPGGPTVTAALDLDGPYKPGEIQRIFMEESPKDIQVGGGHYKDFAIQPIEFITKNGLGFCEGNVIKYVSRYKAKGGREDLEKAKHYIYLLLETLE